MRGALSALFKPLRPRTLPGQIVLFVAGALFVVQLVGFALNYLGQRSQWLTITAAPGVIRVLDALDPREQREAMWQSQRAGRGVELSTAPPPMRGQASPELAQRARDLFANAGIRPLDVRASIDDSLPPGERGAARHARRLVRPERTEAQPRFRVQLTVQMTPTRWYTVHTRSAPVARPLVWRMVMQTLIIYSAILIPLLGFARRLAGPLHNLTQATERIGTPEGAPPVPVRGSDDIAGLITAFNAMGERIRANLEEKDQMLGAIGHDLRTPLTALRLRVESVPDDADREKMISTIDDMQQMLNDILALARVGRDREPPQRVDLAALVEAVTEDHQDLGGDVSIAELSPALIVAHPQAIRRAIGNLIDNAVKYGTRAHVSLSHAAGDISVVVEDEGPGIDPARLDEMLKPFSRLESSRNRGTGGAGLGLAIVKAIAMAEGGRLTLVNRETGGLRAMLTFPAAA